MKERRDPLKLYVTITRFDDPWTKQKIQLCAHDQKPHAGMLRPKQIVGWWGVAYCGIITIIKCTDDGVKCFCNICRECLKDETNLSNNFSIHKHVK